MKKTGITLTDSYDNIINLEIDDDKEVLITKSSDVSFAFKNREELEVFFQSVIELLTLAGKKDEK